MIVPCPSASWVTHSRRSLSVSASATKARNGGRPTGCLLTAVLSIGAGASRTLLIIWLLPRRSFRLHRFPLGAANHLDRRLLDRDHLLRHRAAERRRDVARPGRLDAGRRTGAGGRGGENAVRATDAAQGQRQLAELGGDVDLLGLLGRYLEGYGAAETARRRLCVLRVDRQHAEVLD